MPEINKFLDKMDRERETIDNADRKDLRQFKGFRSEWSKYLEENIDNLYNS